MSLDNVDLRDGIAASVPVPEPPAASVEGAGEPPAESTTESTPEGAPDVAGPATAPASSTEPVAEAATKEPAEGSAAESEAAAGSSAADPDTSAAEPEASFDWTAWDGDIEKAPEDMRPALKAYSEHVTKETKELLAVKDDLIKRYDEFIRNNVGEDPRLLEKSKTLQKIEAEYADFKKRYEELEAEKMTAASATSTQLQDLEQKLIDAEHRHTLRFIQSKPELVGTPELKAQTAELLRDEYQWDVYDLPKLIALPVAQRTKVRELVSSGKVTELDLAIRLVGDAAPANPNKADPAAVGSARRKVAPPKASKADNEPFEKRFDKRKKQIAADVAKDLGFS